MSISGKSLEAVSEADLNSLVASAVAEGLLIEYKREVYAGNDAAKREFLKDISSLANSSGGHLVIGVEERDGIAAGFAPISGDTDSEILRLENLARDCLEPRVLGAQFRAIPMTGGGHVLLGRIPRSWIGPHRVSIGGTNRFYGRNSAGAYELSVTELREKFSFSASALEQARHFHEARVAAILKNDGVVPLAAGGGRLAIHLVPLATGDLAVNLERANEIGDRLRPIGGEGWSPEFNFDGYANIRSGESSAGYTQLFRNGSIEATKIGLVASRGEIRRIPARSFCDPIVAAIPNYLEALRLLDVSPPIALFMVVDGVRGAYLGHSNSMSVDDYTAIRRDRLNFPAVMIDEFGDKQSYERKLRPLFDALWNAGGLLHSTYFTEDGHYHPHN